MRDEIDYIVEWVAYYRLIGVQNILIYDNGGNGHAVAKMAELGVITAIGWPSVEGVSPQVSAYQDATQRLIGVADFVGYFDADEFLVVSLPHTLSSWLSSLGSDVGSIAVNQRVFGSSGRLHHSRGLVTQRFVRCCLETHDECRWFKTICRPEWTIIPPDPHRSRMAKGRYILPNGCDAFSRGTGYVDRNGVVVQTATTDFSIVQLNHYMLKSRAEFERKQSRGGGFEATRSRRMRRYLDQSNYFILRDTYCNATTDTRLCLMTENIKTYAASVGLDAFDRPHAGRLNHPPFPFPWFDAAYYLSSYPDVAKAGLDARTHYDKFGWREGRDPSPIFSTTKYLAANSDVRAMGVNPLSHFLQIGGKEGREVFDAKP